MEPVIKYDPASVSLDLHLLVPVQEVGSGNQKIFGKTGHSCNWDKALFVVQAVDADQIFTFPGMGRVDIT